MPIDDSCTADAFANFSVDKVKMLLGQLIVDPSVYKGVIKWGPYTFWATRYIGKFIYLLISN